MNKLDLKLYEDPISENSTRQLKKVVLFSSFVLLNHYYVVDLSKSYLFGLHFQDAAPPLNGIFGIVILYFSISLAIYLYKDINTWRANHSYYQLNQVTAPLNRIDSRLEPLVSLIKCQSDYSQEIYEEVKKLRDLPEPDKFNDRLTYDNYVDDLLKSINQSKRNLEANSSPLTNHVEDLGKLYSDLSHLVKETRSKYKEMVIIQVLKAGVLETAFPLILAAIALVISFHDIRGIIASIAE